MAKKKVKKDRKVSLEKVLLIMELELTWEMDTPHVQRMVRDIKRLR